MHESVRDFAASAIKPMYVKGNDVLEAGAFDENGSIRGFIEMLQPKSYLATDIRPGPGVDRVCAAEELPANSADLVISMEMLEHAENWQAALLGLALAVRKEGWLMVTTRSPGFPRHDHPGDYWRFPLETMRRAFVACGMDIVRCEPDSYLPGVCLLGKKMRRPDIDALVDIEAEPAPPEN